MYTYLKFGLPRVMPMGLDEVQLDRFCSGRKCNRRTGTSLFALLVAIQ